LLRGRRRRIKHAVERRRRPAKVLRGKVGVSHSHLQGRVTQQVLQLGKVTPRCTAQDAKVCRRSWGRALGFLRQPDLRELDDVFLVGGQSQHGARQRERTIHGGSG
jgi:hypothetical protein